MVKSEYLHFRGINVGFQDFQDDFPPCKTRSMNYIIKLILVNVLSRTVCSASLGARGVDGSESSKPQHVAQLVTTSQTSSALVYLDEVRMYKRYRPSVESRATPWEWSRTHLETVTELLFRYQSERASCAPLN